MAKSKIKLILFVTCLRKYIGRSQKFRRDFSDRPLRAWITEEELFFFRRKMRKALFIIALAYMIALLSPCSYP